MDKASSTAMDKANSAAMDHDDDESKPINTQQSVVSPEEEEDARERDVYKYYRPLEELYSEPTTPSDPDPLLPSIGKLKLRPSPDRALTAFAQLGALRLNARRVMISLLDSRYQYVVAEATKTLSLQKHTVSDLEDDLCFGVNTFERSGTACCEWVTRLTHLAPPKSLSLEQPDHPLIIRDLALDERFCREPYVCGRPFTRFYVGVPIISPAGHIIGAYCVLDDKPRDGLSAAEIDFVKDMAATVMSHLEMVRAKIKSQRGQGMVTGLGNFIAGRSKNKDWWRVERRRSGRYAGKFSSSDAPVPSSSSSQHSTSDIPHRTAEHGKRGQTAPRTSQERAAEQPLSEEYGSETSDVEPPHTQPQNADLDPEKRKGNDLQAGSLSPDARDAFKRAARILRQAVGLDGAIFLDASIGTFGGLVRKAQDDKSSNRGPQDFFSSSGFENEAMDEKSCFVLGKSLGDRYKFNTATSSQPFSVPEDLLHSLLARYPNGKIWNYDEHVRSTTDDDTDELPGVGEPANRRGQRWRERKLIREIFPGVRSLAFIGMWDSNRERWFAGSVLWTCNPTRTLSPEIELNYLVAFGQSIMSEVAALDVKMADKAKTAFISSISHELRTPLHGILGSADCLQSTNLDAFQSSLLNTIDVCGKTLLETFDNLLSYAKINYMTSTGSKDSTMTPQKNSIETRKIGTMGSEHDVLMGALIEEVVDTVFSGQEYLRTGPQPLAEGTVGGLISTASSGASFRGSLSGTSHGLDSINVSVSYSNPGSSRWALHTQPGAWRRIVLNLVGNAIKFTVRGSVNIKLEVAPIVGEEDNTSEFTLIVADTGKGMENEFAETKLFSPFTQEDPLSPGTGLGMSVVKQVVEALNGTVSVKSRPNEGTEVSIIVPLSQGPKGMKASLFHTISERCQGYRLKVLHNAIVSSGLEDPVWTFADLCQKCFDLAVDFDPEPGEFNLYVTCEKHIRSHAGKFSSFFPQGYPRVKTVLIVLSKDSSSARAFKSLKIAGNFFGRVECISQPYGPTKLAKTLATCLDFLSEPFDSRRLSKQPVVGDEPNVKIFPSTTPNASDVVGSAGRSPPPFRRGSSEPGPASISRPAQSIPSQPDTPLVASIDAVVSAKSSEAEDVPFAYPFETSRRSLDSTLNIKVAADVETMTTEHPEPAHALSAPLPASIPRPSVLLVDDNAVNLRLLATFMQKQKRAYTLAENGLEALEAYRAAVPRVVAESPAFSKDFPAYEYVLIDIQMPVMNGLEATRQIRAFERELKLKASKIVALTGFATAGVQQESYASGVDIFLTKPVRLKEVMQIIEKR